MFQNNESCTYLGVCALLLCSMSRDAAPGIDLLTIVPGLLFVTAPKMFLISYVDF